MLFRSLVGSSASGSIIKAKTSLGSSSQLVVNAATGDSHITLENLCFDGNNLQSRTMELVGFIQANDATVRNCLIQNVGYIGLAFGGCQRAFVTGCEFFNTGASAVTSEGGAALWFGANGGVSSYNGRVVGNSFHDLNWTAIYGMCNRMTVTSNVIRNVKEGGIFINNTVTRVTITGNVIQGVTQKNISASGIEAGCNYLTRSEEHTSELQSH